ncbi:TRAP transporter large permease [Marinibacterium profundimaris]|uniref:C4-dicarboxylate ABC transporter permease n=1 Tax=Marinibacterium profundimaris TaxID=1679460 RepID=A0A225NSA5_9RHOB|nr:TRAP transporter large permease subunit [Marinibacterium profundimaris]OWU77824.1 C4-dicarboxylate ABC transporter permease [Marinibacterium profundimaris]
MELFFLALLILIMAAALGSGFPVAFALPGAAIITITLAAVSGHYFAGNTDAFFHSGGPQQWLTAGVTNLRGVYWEVERDTLIAIPLFIFMGIMLQRSKIAEDLLVTMAQLFGPVPGGLGISVVFVGALLAATTGIVGATVVAMGLISLPAMLRNNYSQPLATGTIAASGTLGQIIPPSIVLIILADQLASATDQASTMRKALHKEATGELSMPSVFDVTSTSAGEMFLGAFVPGIVLVLIYMAFILIFAILRPKLAPAVPYTGHRDAAFWGQVFLTLVPPLALIFLVLGSIIAGIATVNQAGAIGAAGALIMAGYRLPDKDTPGLFIPALIGAVALGLIAFALSTYNMNVKAVLSMGTDMTGIWIGALATVLLLISLIWSGARVLKIENTMHEVMIETAKTTSLVFIILLGAAMLTAAFRAFGGEELVREFLNSLPGGFWSQFVIVMAVIFILGFFLDFIEIAVVVVPIVAPILLADPQANITAVWLGVMIGLNIQTSFLTPPFGFALFYLRGVAPPEVKTTSIYKGVIAFIVLQLAALGIVGYMPSLVNYLPNRVSLLSETAPPPRNPKLQLCLEDYVWDKLQQQEDALRGAISQARGLNVDVLPRRMAGDITEAFDDAETAIDTMSEIIAAEAAVDAAAPDFRPLLTEVRGIQKQVRDRRTHADDLLQRARYMNNESQAERRAELEAEAAELQAEADAIEATIPDEWADAYATFNALVQAEQRARNTYRRAADGSVEPVMELMSVLGSNAAFAELEDRLRGMEEIILNATPEEAEAALDGLGSAFNDVQGASGIASALSSARRDISRGRTDDALEEWREAIEEYDEQASWRGPAADALAPGLASYLDTISDTIGARQQPELSRDQALYLASCNSHHRDLSLNF